MEELVIAGKQYVSSKRASQMTGYTKDYIGQMCRAGKLDSKLVGRNWYVEPRSLLHLSSTSTKKASKTNTVDSARPSREYKTAERALNEGSFLYEPENVSYEADTRPLVPELQQVPIATTEKEEEAGSLRESEIASENTHEEEPAPVVRMRVHSKPSLNAVDLRLAGLAAKEIQNRAERRNEAMQSAEKESDVPSKRFVSNKRGQGAGKTNKLGLLGAGVVTVSIVLTVFGMMSAKEIVYPLENTKYSFSVERLSASVSEGLSNLVSTR